MTKFLVGLEKFLHSLTHSFCRYIVKALTFPYLFLKRQKVLHLFCKHPTQEPLLHWKQRFLFYRLPGEPAAFLLDPLRTAERGGPSSAGSRPVGRTPSPQAPLFRGALFLPRSRSAAPPVPRTNAPLVCPRRGTGDADFPLLHRKQRFLFYRSPGEPAAF